MNTANGDRYKKTFKANILQRETTAFSLPAILGILVLFYLGILQTAKNQQYTRQLQETSQTSDAFHKSNQQMPLSWHGVLQVALIKKKHQSRWL